MRRIKNWVQILMLIFLSLTLCQYNNYSWAENQEVKAAGNEKTGKEKVVADVDEAKLSELSVTQHMIMIDGKPLRYTATAGYMLMKNDKEELEATIFFIAYTSENRRNDPGYPITFTFNGGPGSASLWLHMGALGPKRVAMSADGFPLPQPFSYKENPYTWLSFTDLVFIDPVSTGYSRAAQGVEQEKFHGLKADAASVGEFIRLYVTRNQRWLSPKFVCGESYGTTRAAALSGYLQDHYGMYLQGLVLVSAIMDFQTARFAFGNDGPPALFLPTYTAAAWYHQKLPGKYQQDLTATLEEVEKWAISGYWQALAKGDTLTEGERKEVIEKLSQYTGLSSEYIDQNNLRIEIYSFTRELLRDTKQRIGRLDSRFKCMFTGNVESGLEEDPSYSGIYGSFTAAINDYTSRELNFKTDRAYWPISHMVQSWNWDSSNIYVNVAEILREAMIKNNNLKVMIANGYYDLATPYLATLYTVNHMNLPRDLARQIQLHYYQSGHMIYIHEPSLKKLFQDTRAFYQETIAKQ